MKRKPTVGGGVKLPPAPPHRPTHTQISVKNIYRFFSCKTQNLQQNIWFKISPKY